MKTQSRFCILDTIERSARSRNAIMTNKTICYHYPFINTKRLHWQCDFSKWVSSTLKNLRHQVPFPRSRFCGIDNVSSSSSSKRSSPFLTQVPSVWMQWATWESKRSARRDRWFGAHWVTGIHDSMPIIPTLRFVEKFFADTANTSDTS